MFSRAAKSIVKSISQRRYHAGEENLKVAMIGGAEIGRSLSQILKKSSKLDVLALYDIAAVNQRFSSTSAKYHNFSNGEPLNSLNPRILTMLERSKSGKDTLLTEALQEPIGSNSPRTLNSEKFKIDELVENLHRLPIAEEPAGNQLMHTNKMAQGDNEPRGPQVLAERGPDKFQRGGRIISEICRQFPSLAMFLKDNSFGDVSHVSRRRFSGLASCDGSISNGDNCDDRTSVKILKNDSKIKEEPSEKDSSKIIHISPECLAERRSVNGEPPIERKKFRSKRPRGLKVTEVPMRIDKDLAGVNKSKNWTIPAVLSDKKPKMLYGLVRQRRASVTWFFSKIFGVQGEAVDAHCNKTKIPRFDKVSSCTQSSKPFEFNEDAKLLNVVLKEKLNASTSMSDLAPKPIEQAIPSKTEAVEIIESPVEQAIEEKMPTSSNEDSDFDTISHFDEQYRAPVRRISSRIEQFLENLKLNRRQSHSLSSLTSYNLDSLFADQEIASIWSASNSVLFSCNSGDSKSSLKDKLVQKLGCKQGKTEDSCKKKQNTCKKKSSDSCQKKKDSRSCSEKRLDMCKKKDTCKPTKSCTTQKKEDPCKKKKEDPCKKKEDPCKKKKEDPCKKKKEDPCKKKKEDPCKKKKEDPCKKKKEDPCKKKEDPCKKKEDPCKKISSCTTQKKEDPCKKKKEDPCKKTTSCTTQKKEDPCKKKKEDPCKKTRSCTTQKKEDPCKKKKEDPCKKTTSCTTQKKEDPCKKKKEDPCKKTTSCTTQKKEDPCKKKKEDPCKKTRSCTTQKKEDPCKVTPKKEDKCKKSTSCTTQKSDSTCKGSDTKKNSVKLSTSKSCAHKKKESPCKKQTKDSNKDKCQFSCGDTDPCKNFTEQYGAPCKKYQEPEELNEEICKKLMNESMYGKSCKTGEDPCKKMRNPEIYGKLCKECGVSDTKSDPCDILWKDDIYGVRCNNTPKNNTSTTCSSAKQKSCNTVNKQAYCSSSAKKSDSCSSTCKKQDSCSTTSKKQDSCSNTCKKQDSCGKPVKHRDTCNNALKKKDSCSKAVKKKDSCGSTAKKQDPCCSTAKKQEPCSSSREHRDTCNNTIKKEDPCSDAKKQKSKSKCSGQKPCPPVFRAPGCKPKERKGKKKEEDC